MKRNLMVGGVDISLPNVSYCEDVKDVHYTPYNLVRFYVGEITEPKTVSIYTDIITSVDVQVSKGNKWYSYVLPKYKGLYKIKSGYYDSDEGEWYDGIVTKAVVKANITENNGIIIPYSTVEASFKGSNTSKVTIMNSMFSDCSGLTSLDVSSFDTSNVTDMGYMFSYCNGLTLLDLSSFDISNVTHTYNMFYYCRKLETLDISGWDTSNVTDMVSMFAHCDSLRKIKMVGCSQTTIDKIKAQLTKDNITGVTIVTE